jgi:hypothetical protein
MPAPAVIERTPAPVEKTQTSPVPLATLIPKISAPPLMPVRVRTRPQFQSASPPDETRAEQAETIINVAIGRIEVRATPAETASRQRQRSSGPRVMKLDEYLHQRSQGSQ